MKNFKKIVALVTAFAMFGSANAQNCYVSNTGGCGYMECRRAPCITPAVALGTIALVAIIAVAVQNSHGRGAHGHSHNGSTGSGNDCGCN